MNRNITLMVLLISLLAVCAYAQADTKVDQGEKGEMALDRHYGDGDGDNHELGMGHRKGDDFIGETGPHGPMSTDSFPDFLLVILKTGKVILLIL